MKKDLGIKLLLASPVLLIFYIFIDDFVYKFPSWAFSIILLIAALGLYLIATEKED